MDGYDEDMKLQHNKDDSDESSSKDGSSEYLSLKPYSPHKKYQSSKNLEGEDERWKSRRAKTTRSNKARRKLKVYMPLSK